MAQTLRRAKRRDPNSRPAGAPVLPVVARLKENLPLLAMRLRDVAVQ